MTRSAIARLVLVTAAVVGIVAISATVADKRGRRSLPAETTGNVVEIVESVQENELPKPVAAAMHSHPRAIYVSGMKVTRGADVEYRLTLRGTRKTTLVARPDGSVLSFK